MTAVAARSSRGRGRSASFPGFVEPALATLRDKAPEGAEWVHEIKCEGNRVQAHLQAGKATIYTRAGFNWTTTFKTIADELPQLRARELIIDGEVVVLDAEGVPDFAALQSELARRESDRLTARLVELVRDPPSGILRFSDHLSGDGAAMFKQACAMRLEGIVSKRADAPYLSGRTENWIKVKCTKEGAFPIIAFVEKLGANPRRIASLYPAAGTARGSFTPERRVAVTASSRLGSFASGWTR